MFKGTSASAGIGIGKAVSVEEAELKIRREAITDPAAEKIRFQSAVKQAMEETDALAKDLATRVGEKEAEILNGHLLLLSDPMLTGEIENTITGENVNSEFAIEQVCNTYADMFASMGDELMQQRATDMRDIKTRVQKILMGISSVDISALPEGTVIIAKDLTPSMTAGINPDKVVGIVTELGGKTSHSAILARALEIPAVVAIEGFLNQVSDGDDMILDGSQGIVLVNPEDSVKSEYAAKREAFLKEKKELEQYIGKPTVTKDGASIELVANIGKPEDVEKVLHYDGEGIGLFRTEFLFMDRTSMPTEDEQFEAYQKVAVAMNGKPVIIRTLDIGGDKEIPYMGLKKDENPFLGYRAIRFCLDRKEDVYKPQLRALLRASAFGNIRIMVPMVTCLEEYREAKALVEALKKELDEKGLAYNKDIQVGIMVETAAASLMADVFAKEVDFFSIGTNDLTQYTMSVDRGNDKVSYLYSPLNPAVLRSIRHVIECGRREGIMVGMCGEAASDPLLIPLLLAFGLNEFSMSASAILNARKLITGYSIKELQAVAEKAMSFSTVKEVEDYMKEFISRI
ncbi:phosphoenolpyruvate--protein phosphotransferase [Lacrimispora saccharolytica]|uniref:Phosphoenolpyruvate-protein phosphotransferase n=1 Tax=Lacrimispora saccharolytica (strain ATCC 35040 / DSM 2544 / NRCC 2533 / WM1) TaxID=610130 RepID=D9R8A2_LACSW|nr:phosphoenolpyruvate--protein phosphotransferase [Lacrimispora saccharolytica]ADL03854.1 phosphoenolpyruvate-protein phosphotransferase [[Clostridium] saccharolyticum WM1]QRV21829.1 phosphoenolpyruvate--protein phosphotransferase [Lacrimispora saccharolytica]